MAFELVTFTDRRIPEVHVGSAIASKFVPALAFEIEPGERHHGIEAVTVFNTRRALKKRLAEEGYTRFHEIRHREMAVL